MILGEICNIAGFVRVIYILKIAFKVICVLVPVYLIVSCSIYIAKNIMNNEKDLINVGVLIRKVIAAIIVFLLPGLFKYIFTFVNYDSSSVKMCFENATLEKIKQLEKNELDDENDDFNKNKKIIEEGGKERKKREAEDDETYGTLRQNNDKTYTGGKVVNISMQYNVKDPEGRCGKGSGDKCIEVANVTYSDGSTRTFYMGAQNNSGLLDGSCRAHAFTAGMNATNNTKYSTLDLQNYMETIDGNGVFKGSKKINAAIEHFNVPAKAYFNETSISQSVSLAREALDDGKPVIIFVSGKKCSDLAGSHHALLLLGYDDNGDVIFMDSVGRYKTAKKRNLDELGSCMSGDKIAKNWMRMVIFE